MSRCIGHCCRKFCFPFSPYELNALKESIDNGTRLFTKDNGEQLYNKFADEEVMKLHSMLIYIDKSNINPETELQVEKESHHYTCKHFNTETNNCMNYENRPNMCRDYPEYGKDYKCKYKGCTYHPSEQIEKV